MNRAQMLVRAWWPVVLVAAGAVALLLAVATGYGLHRDEMYFIVAGRHPAFGYIDQPPITPLLNAFSAALFGVSSFGDRVLPSLSMGAVVLLSAAIAREFGGGRLAQFIAALTVGASGCLAVYHLNSTEAYDVLGTTAFLLLVVRLLRGADPRLWLAAGVAAGITLEDKNLILFVGAGLAAGVLIARRWELLKSKWLWAGMAIALAIWLPNLIWQAANGWPQLEMARSIGSGDNRSSLLLLQILFAGPLLFPIFLAGIWWLLRSKASAAWRPIGWAYLVVLILIFATSGKGYYSGGTIPTMIAAGSVVAAGWLARGRTWVRGLKGAGYAVATAGSAFLIVALSLPIVPVASFPASSAAKSDPELVSEFGWPSFVAQVRSVSDSLAPADRAHTAIVTANYGQAGALQLLSAPGLPPVYSGHNSYWAWGPPDESRTITILVGWDDASYWPQWLGPCTHATKIDLGFPPDIGGEQGAGVWVCRGRTAPWTEIWSHFRSVG